MFHTSDCTVETLIRMYCSKGQEVSALWSKMAALVCMLGVRLPLPPIPSVTAGANTAFES